MLFHASLFVLATLLALCIGVGVSTLAGLEASSEPALRSAGGMLQLLGVAAVGYGIMQLRREFGLPSLSFEWRAESKQVWEQARKWAVKRLRRPQSLEPPLMGSASGSLGGLSIKARGKVRYGTDATVEQRLALVERILDQIQDATWNLEDRVEAQHKQILEALSAETNARTTAIAEVQNRFHQYATSDLHLEIVGLGWVLFGTVLSTWAPEIARTL